MMKTSKPNVTDHSELKNKKTEDTVATELCVMLHASCCYTPARAVRPSRWEGSGAARPVPPARSARARAIAMASARDGRGGWSRAVGQAGRPHAPASRAGQQVHRAGASPAAHCPAHRETPYRWAEVEGSDPRPWALAPSPVWPSELSPTRRRVLTRHAAAPGGARRVREPSPMRQGVTAARIASGRL